jgi:DNA-binding CsgD family transcriptional regulator
VYQDRPNALFTDMNSTLRPDWPSLATPGDRLGPVERLDDVTRFAPALGRPDEIGGRSLAMAGFCARRAWVAWLRGELRDAVTWSRDGLWHSPGHDPCRNELARAAAALGDLPTAEGALSRAAAAPHSQSPGGFGPTGALPWVLAARGDLDAAARAALDAAGSNLVALHDVVRLGAPERVAERLAERAEGELAPVFARHAAAFAARDGAALDKAAGEFADLGLILHAAETAAHAAVCHRGERAARTSRAHATALARSCQGARTPALIGLIVPQLTARQRQIICLAAAGLTNREIAGRLRLSIRTVGNHLCAAYERLGTSDRAALADLFTPAPAR